MKKALKSRVPADLRTALAASPSVAALWEDLTPIARRDFLRWITSAKQPETRKRRIERVPDMLTKGKRRPCCYAVVPMQLYRALAREPKAKAQWSTLTPDERRDVVDWIDGAENAETLQHRVAQACKLLAAGKRLI